MKILLEPRSFSSFPVFDTFQAANGKIIDGVDKFGILIQ